MLRETKTPELNGLKKHSFSKSRRKCGENLNPHTVWFDDNRIEKWLDRLHLIFLGLSVSIASPCICLSFFFSSDCSHTHTNIAAVPVPPLWSSNMQLGSWMIKAVAGGLHFETINRPLGAESNSKPSISVSLNYRWHRGWGHAEGERAASSSASTLCIEHAAEKPWSNYG